MKTSTCHSFRPNILFSVSETAFPWHRHHQNFKELLGIWNYQVAHSPIGYSQPSLVTFLLLLTRPSLFLGYTSPNINSRALFPVLNLPHQPSLTSSDTQQPPLSLANFDIFLEFKMPVAHESRHKQPPWSSQFQARKRLEWGRYVRKRPYPEVDSFQLCNSMN